MGRSSWKRGVTEAGGPPSSLPRRLERPDRSRSGAPLGPSQYGSELEQTSNDVPESHFTGLTCGFNSVQPHAAKIDSTTGR